MARWYRDSATNDLNAALFLKAASAGADAVGRVAQIPLDIDNRNFRDKKLALEEKELGAKQFIAKLNNDTKLSVADKRAAWENYATSAGLEGKYATAGARDNATNASLVNNERTTKAQRYVQDSREKIAKYKGQTQEYVAALNKKAKAPVEVVTYDNDGKIISSKVTRAYKKDPISGLTIPELSRVAKKAKKNNRRR